MEPMTESLPELIRRRMDDLGLTRLSELHRRLPHGDDYVSYETLRRAAAGQQVEGEKMLRAVAIMCGVPENTVRAAAGQPLAHGEWELPAAAQSLTIPERRVVESVIDAIVRAKKGQGHADAPAQGAPITPITRRRAAGLPVDEAAYQSGLDE